MARYRTFGWDLLWRRSFTSSLLPSLSSWESFVVPVWAASVMGPVSNALGNQSLVSEKSGAWFVEHGEEADSGALCLQVRGCTLPTALWLRSPL